MRPRLLAVMAVVLGIALIIPAAYARLDDGGTDSEASVPTPAPAAPPPPTLADAPVSVPFEGEFFSWALMDRQTDTISGAENLTDTSSTESMIKVWFAADYLNQLGDESLSTTMRDAITTAIRDSNDDAANLLYREVGRSATIDRMISTCGLTDTKPGTVPGYIGWWSFTQMSPRDAVRLGDCIADGTAAGPTWTEFLLDEMSQVRGTTAADDQNARSGGGRWGIIDGLPESITSQGPVGMKNGWTALNYDGNWHVNCLAVNDQWSLAVMMRYPQQNGLDYGAQTCASVATQLVTPQPGAALKVPQQPTGDL